MYVYLMACDELATHHVYYGFLPKCYQDRFQIHSDPDPNKKLSTLNGQRFVNTCLSHCYVSLPHTLDINLNANNCFVYC